MNEFNLSDKIWEVNSNCAGDPDKDAIDVFDVKEFIRRLKEKTKTEKCKIEGSGRDDGRGNIITKLEEKDFIEISVEDLDILTGDKLKC